MTQCIQDDAVRALHTELHNTFRRMEAIEGRHLSAIITLKEAADERQPPPLNRTIATMLYTLRRLK